MPEVQAGDDVAALLAGCLAAQDLSLFPGDVVVVSSKIVSKAMGLRSSAPKDEVVASQTRRVVAERATPGGGLTRVVESAAGPVMAAAGVDASNTGGADGLLLLPEDPDGTAAALRSALLAASGLAEWVEIGVVVSDTAGRPWRVGQVDFALGAAGVATLDDLRGSLDGDGRELSVTARAIADELAAAADLVKGKAEGIPAVLVRGSTLALGAKPLHAPGQADAGAARLIRTGPGDWFDYGRAEAVRAALGIEPGSAEAAAVGIPAVGDEPFGERVLRAVAVALRPLAEVTVEETDEAKVLDGLGVDGVKPDEESGEAVVVDVVVRAPDPYQLGEAVARLRVALWGEGIRVRESSRLTDTAASLTLESAL
jgi:coenzyme F420-0:L-glutamate ligase/coenzyme F420-1:gamma-L-glutamate ligase